MQKFKLSFFVLAMAPFMLLAEVTDSSLVAHYSFGFTTEDYGIFKNDGVAYNVIPAEDRFGHSDSSYYFNGTNAWITVPSSPSLNPKDQLTINLWLKPGVQTNRYVPILHKGGPFQNDFINREYVLYLADEAQIYAESSGDSMVRRYINTAVLEENDWFMFSVVFDLRNHQMTNYLNGKKLYSLSNDYSFITNNDDSLTIGTWVESNPLYAEYYTGYMDDLRIYNRALNEVEIAGLFSENGYVEMIIDTIQIYDTVYVYDTINIYDTVSVESYDTIQIFDTIYVYDTINIYDTVSVEIYDSISVIDTLIIDAIFTGLDSKEFYNRLKIYPNPARRKIFIDTGEEYEKLSGHTIRILNTGGVVVYVSSISQQLMDLSVDDLGSPGLYILQIVDSNATLVSTKKILLE